MNSLHLPVTFASIWPDAAQDLELLADSADGEVKLALRGIRYTYEVILHARRADVARLLWPEEATCDGK